MLASQPQRFVAKSEFDFRALFPARPASASAWAHRWIPQERPIRPGLPNHGITPWAAPENISLRSDSELVCRTWCSHRDDFAALSARTRLAHNLGDRSR